jgi:membrane protease subunit HflK
VIEAFRDVQRARAEEEQVQNEAQTYANKVIPEARGQVARINQAGEAYREQTVAEATGQTSRFVKVLDEYKKAPDVTRQRMYLETMERLFSGTEKIILDSGNGGSAVVPYVALDELLRRGGGQPTPSPTPPTRQPGQAQAGGIR